MYPGKLPKRKFVAKINTACRYAWRKIRHDYRESKFRRKPTQSLEAWRTEALKLIVVGGIDFHIFDAIRILHSPPHDERVLEETVGPMQEAVERAQRVNPVRSTSELPARFSEYNRHAAAYGLKACLVTPAHVRL